MIKNYFKIAIRSILKNRISSLVNIIGLSISMVVGVMIFAHVKSNWDTDHFHPFIGRTFRITTQIENETSPSRWATCPQPISTELDKLSFVDKTTTIRHGGQTKIMVQSRDIPVEITFGEPSFFEVLGFQLLTGNLKQFFGGENAVLLGEETAKRLFEDRNPIGETVLIDGWGTFEIAGVIEKPILKTHIPVEVMLPLDIATALENKGLLPKGSEDWGNFKSASVYALINSENDLLKLNSELKQISESSKSKANNYTFSAQNIEDITPWDPAIQNDFYAGMNWMGILTWVFLALALTLLAAFNYTAMSVAHILARASEVGIRKTNGALRKQIFFQFIIESVLLSCIALMVAYLVLLVMNQSGDIGLIKNMNIFPDFQFVALLLIYTILTGFVAGAIPAWVLSKFNPIEVLKNLQTIRLVRRVNIYKAILIVQFSVTITLTIFFVILKDTGLHGHKMLMSKLPENITVIDLKGKQAILLIDPVEQISQVQKVAMSDHLPVMNPTEKCTLKVVGQSAGLILHSGFIDRDFIDIFNLKLVMGSNFPAEQPQSLEQYALINESAGRLLMKGMKNKSELIGQIVTLDSATVQIVGVLADDSFPMPEVLPSLFGYKISKPRFISIKSVAGSGVMVGASLKNIWMKNFPHLIPEIYGFKERNLREYQMEMSNVNLSFGLVCGIVMFVSCLGIFGMANYAVTSNRMQIGVRKTFGANNLQLIMSVTKPFIQILVIAGIIGIPLGWLCGSLLDRRFGFHVDVGMYNLVVGYALVVLVALMVVISQTLRSAYINPADVLKAD